MEKDSRQLKRSLTRAVAGICLLLLAATGTTFAWFTITGEASTNVTPTGGTISSGDTTLLISANADGPFEETCNLIPEGTPETLKPVSTADPAHFYRATAQNREGISVLYANADQRVDTDTLHKAQEHPEEYKNLVVRIAGYSAYFVELGRDLQNDILARNENKI